MTKVTFVHPTRRGDRIESEEAVAGVHEASFYWYLDFIQAQRSGLEVAWRASA